MVKTAEYIEREAALESLCTGCEYVPIDEKENCPYRFTGCQEYANIFSIPAADVVPVRHGRWIVIAEFNDCVYARCDQCKIQQVFYHNKPLTNYCPSCGARMDIVTDCNQKDGDGDV